MIRQSTPAARIGLACAGGVVEGAFYEVGALCALGESVRGLDLNRLHVYVGVSAGAIVAAGLANGISPAALAGAVLGRPGDGVEPLRPDMLLTPAAGEYARRMLRVPVILAAALGEYVAHRGDLSLAGALSELKDALPVGFFDSRPLERYMARVLSTGGRTNDFRELDTQLRIVAVNLDTSELAVFGGPGTQHVPISRAVQASTALPVLYPPVEIDGQGYIDGVARRTLNATSALDAGAELLFCINPIVPVDLRKGGVPGEHMVKHGLPAVLSQTLRTLVHSRLRTAFRAYEHSHPHADLVLIEPEAEDPTLFFSNLFSFTNRFHVVEYGYSSTRAFLLREADRLEPVLARHGLSLDLEVLRDRTRHLTPGITPSLRAPARRSRGPRQALERLDTALDRLGGVLARR